MKLLKLEALSIEQTALMPTVRDEWIAHALGGDTSMDVEAATEEIVWLYRLANLKAPRAMVLDSPMGCCVAAKLFGAQVDNTAYFGAGYDAGWLAFYDFFARIGVLQHDGLNHMIRFVRSGVWDCVLLRGIALLSRRPESVTKDEQGRLHNAAGAAVRFRDGYAVHAWHGTRVPRAWIAEPETIDTQLALTHENIDQRRALCEIIGWERVLGSLNQREIQRDADPLVGTLIEVDLPDTGASRFLRVQCGTGRLFVLPVPIEMRSAREANAWTYGLMAEQLKVEVRT